MQDYQFLEEHSFSCNAKNTSHFFNLAPVLTSFLWPKMSVKEQILVLYRKMQFICHQNSTGIQLNV